MPYRGRAGVAGGVHTGEVEHGHVLQAVVVDGKLELWQLEVGGEVCGLASKGHQPVAVNVGRREQLASVHVVLADTRGRCYGVR